MEKKKKTNTQSKVKKTTKTARTGSPIKKTVKKSPDLTIKKYLSDISNNFTKNKKLYVRYALVVLVIILIGVFAFIKKNWFVVAVVNGQPITTVDFYQSLKAKDGKEVLEQMIRNKVISQEANKKGIIISESEINKKIGEIEKQVGGKDQLKSALEARNITQADFRDQIKLQLTVERLLSKEINVTDKEINDYLAKNPTDSSGSEQNSSDPKKREEIKNQLRSQKLNDTFQGWYDKLEKSANILKF